MHRFLPFLAVAASAAISPAQQQVAIPAFSSTLADQFARGFFFQAPSSFLITGIRVPDESQQGVQSVEIDRIECFPPPFPGTAQASQLFHASNQPSANIVPCCILVQTGDFIGVLGACGTTTMFTSVAQPQLPFASAILGQPVTLTAILTPTNLSTTAGGGRVSSDLTGFGRVELFVQPLAGSATAFPFGHGCVDQFTSFYESFAEALMFDLSNQAMTMVFAGPGYTVVPGLTGFVAPSGAAVSLNLFDDSEVTVPLNGSFLYAGGATSALTVCSNGFVSVAPGNSFGNAPLVATMLAFPQTAWGCWHDFAPFGPGPIDQVMFEQIGTTAYVTWNGVNDYANALSSTWQMQFELPTGNVHFVFQAMNLGGGQRGNPYLVFYSPGGPSSDPGNRDLSATLPQGFSVGASDVPALTLTGVTRPVSRTTCSLVTGNIPAGTPFGALLLGFRQFNPGLDLAGIGMPGCALFTDGAASLLFLAPGASATTSFGVPNGFAGLHVFAQSAVFAPAAGLTPLGAIASNGIDLRIDNT